MPSWDDVTRELLVATLNDVIIPTKRMKTRRRGIQLSAPAAAQQSLTSLRNSTSETRNESDE